MVLRKLGSSDSSAIALKHGDVVLPLVPRSESLLGSPHAIDRFDWSLAPGLRADWTGHLVEIFAGTAGRLLSN